MKQKNIVKLKNNIKIISHRLTNTHSTTISVNFMVGSLNENIHNRGITHLVEHLFFRQLDNMTQDELYHKMYSLGSEIHASTNYNYVKFSMKVIPELLIEAFDLLIKLLTYYNWSSEIISKEKAVVLNQIQNDYQTYDDIVNSYYFYKTDYQYPIMGTKESIQSLTTEEINNWKNSYFSCNNAYVIVTGNFSGKDYNYIEEKLSELNNLGIPLKNKICFPQNFKKRNKSNRYTIVKTDSDNCDVIIFFDIYKNCDYETLRLLTSILSEGCGSLIPMELREKHFFTDDIYTDLTDYYSFYRLSISYLVNKNNLLKSIECIIDIITNTYNNIKHKDYTSSITFFTKNQLMDYDNQDVLNERYFICDCYLENAISDPLQLKSKYESISIYDLQECAKKVFTKDNISFLLHTNEEKMLLKNSIEKILMPLI